MILLKSVLWISIVLVIYNYVLFPLFIIIKSKNKTLPFKFHNLKNCPKVSVIIAAYNEEEVISEKINSILNSSFPLSKIEILIGSDNSNDGTNKIVSNFEIKYPQVKLVNFTERTGKPKIIDTLKDIAKNDILILTDANVFFDKNTIYEITKYFADDSIGLIGGNIINKNLKKNGISFQENQYLDIENQIKFGEGVLFGSMIGAFGGVFSIHKKYYTEVPKGFISDDFFISMNVLLKKKKAIFNKMAYSYEDISNNIKDEFNRKTRISIGNFQNLSYLIKNIKQIKFSLLVLFISHKVLRWLTPFLLLIILTISIIVKNQSLAYHIIYTFNILFYSSILIDYILKKMNVHLKLLRVITHFVSMNIAILFGFYKFITSTQSNIWTPTKRNQ